MAMVKTAVLTAAMWVVPALACASNLVVGVVHDTDGYPVDAATIDLRTAGGSSSGRAMTAADGTFAIATDRTVATIDVRCAYCMRTTVARGRDDSRLAIVVRRFAALRDRGISVADARVLPYASVTTMASLLPFAVASGGSISDRGLAHAEGTVVADGIPLYRATDGVDVGTAIPAHATASIAETDPTAANAYGARSAAGLFSFDTLDASAGTARLDAGPALDGILRAAGMDVNGVLATVGGSAAASRGVVDAALPAAGGTIDLRAVDASGYGANAGGAAATFAFPIAGSALHASVSAVRSNDANGPENDGLAALSLQRGILTFGLRAQNANGPVDDGSGTQYDARGFVTAAQDIGQTHIFASLAAVRAGEAVYDGASATGALLPIVSIASQLFPHVLLHAESVDALIPTALDVFATEPQSTAIVRSHLLDAGVGFDDGDRLRVDAMVYRQLLSGDSAQITAGSGIATIWQIGPSIALHAWTLIAHQSMPVAGDYPYAAGSDYATGGGNFDRDIVWVTAGTTLRVDAIERGGKIDGDASLPLGSQIRVIAGTRREKSGRIVSLGLTYR
jgi:hypothetical protein